MKIIHNVAYLTESSRYQFTISRTILQKIKDLFQKICNRYPTNAENVFLEQLSHSLSELTKSKDSPLYGYNVTQLIEVVENSRSIQTIINQLSSPHY